MFPVSADGGRTAALRSALLRQDPDVEIEIPFDRLLYRGDLRQVGTFVQTFRGIEVYQIKAHNAEYGKWVCGKMNNALFGKINKGKKQTLQNKHSFNFLFSKQALGQPGL